MAIKIFKNGIIHTLEDEQPTVQSVVIKEGRIIAVGDDILKDYIEEASEIIDLNGKCMVPGFYDSHGHFTMAGAFYQYMLNLSPAPIGVVKSVVDCQQKLKEYISTHPNKKFILGWGYNEQEIAEKRHLTKADIDAVSEDRMVLILHASNHIAYANSLLLETVGYHKDTPNPVGGTIHKDPLTGQENWMAYWKNVPIWRCLYHKNICLKCIDALWEIGTVLNILVSNMPRWVLQLLMKAVVLELKVFK